MQAPIPIMVYTMAMITATLIPAMSPADKPGASVLTSCEAEISFCGAAVVEDFGSVSVCRAVTDVLRSVLVLASG